MKKPAHGKRSSAKRDPLIDEVRRIRTDLSAEYGHDLGKLCNHLREVQASYGCKVVHKRSKRSPA